MQGRIDDIIAIMDIEGTVEWIVAALRPGIARQPRTS
jgi:hypothetical protein